MNFSVFFPCSVLTRVVRYGYRATGEQLLRTANSRRNRLTADRKQQNAKAERVEHDV